MRWGAPAAVALARRLKLEYYGWGSSLPTIRLGAGFESKENKMRIAAGLIFAGAGSLLALGAAWSPTPPAKGAASPQAAPAPAAAAAAPTPAIRPPCNNPNAPGL